MLDYLDTLRRKPKHVRMQITYVTTSVIFLVILFMWWNSWTTESKSQKNTIREQQSPLSIVTDTFTGMKDETVSSWKGTMANIQNLASTTPETTDMAAVGMSEKNSVATEESASVNPTQPQSGTMRLINKNN